MRCLHKFTLNKEEEVEKQEETKNEAGETVITKKKEKQLIPYNYFIARPSRSLADQASLYNSVQVSIGLRGGLLSIFQLDKKYREEGVFTEEDNNKYKELYDILIKNIEELQKLTAKTEAERSEEEKKRIEEITESTLKTRTKLRDYENIKNNLYTHSAEFRARNMTMTWWLLFLAYKEENGKEIPFFLGSSLDDKLKAYDQIIEQNDVFTKGVIDHFIYFISYWLLNNTEKPEDFAELEKFIESEKKNAALNV